MRGLSLPQRGIPDLVSSPREASLSSEEWMGVEWEEMGGVEKGERRELGLVCKIFNN